MRTYEISQIVEIVVTWKVRAADANAANEEAVRRTRRLTTSIARTRKNISFGDITDDYIPARDEE